MSNGAWKTMPNGERVLIQDGQTLEEVFKIREQYSVDKETGKYQLGEEYLKNKVKSFVSMRDKSDLSEGLNEDKENSVKAHVKNGELLEERKKLHDKIIESHFLNEDGTPLKPVDKPEFMMMGGGPAAGKSSVPKSGQIKIPKETVEINSDDIKEQLPEYKKMINSGYAESAAGYMHEESSFLTKNTMKLAFENKYNTLLDGTGDGSEKSLLKKINDAKKAGLSVKGIYVTCDTDDAVKRAITRGKKQGRYVDEKIIRKTHAKVSQLLPKVADQFTDVKLFDTSQQPPILIATGGNGQKLTPVAGEEELYFKFLAKANENTIK